jgi:Mannosyltransferase (PIG-V)
MRSSPGDLEPKGRQQLFAREIFARALPTLTAVAIWAALLFAWSYAARNMPVEPREGWAPDVTRRAPPLARYDSGWFHRIAEHGYGAPPAPGDRSEHVFFPLYPAVVAAVARALGVNAFAAGLGVSVAATLAAALLFVAEGRRRGLDDAGARHALLFLLLFPTAFFLVAMYAESLFLLLALLAFAAVARRRFAAAGLFALLAGLTRLPALALCVPLAIAAGAREEGEAPRGEGRSTLLRAALVGAAPAAGVALWIFGVGWHFGEPDLYFRLQRSWDRGVAPLAGLTRWALSLPQRLARGDARAHPAFLIEYADALLFAGIAVLQARRRRWADAAWSAGALLLPAATGISASLPRYLVVVYPAFYTLAEAFRARPRARVVWWALSGLLLLAGTAAFVLWRWVA